MAGGLRAVLGGVVTSTRQQVQRDGASGRVRGSVDVARAEEVATADGDDFLAELS